MGHEVGREMTWGAHGGGGGEELCDQNTFYKSMNFQRIKFKKNH